MSDRLDDAGRASHVLPGRVWLMPVALGLVAVTLGWAAGRLGPRLTATGWKTSVEPVSSSPYHPGPTSLPGAETVFLASRSAGWQAFRIAWSGCLLADEPGRYRVVVQHAGPTRLTVDGRLLIRPSEVPGARVEVAEIDLGRGAHSVQLYNEQPPGRAALQLWIQRPDGPLRLLEEEAARLAPQCLPEDLWRWRAVTTWLPVASVSAWLAAALSALLIAGLAAARATCPDPAFWKGLGWWLAASVAACAFGVWWGVPEPLHGWAADEITPAWLLRAYHQGFAPPWADKYPPLHYYVLSLPALLVQAAGAPFDIVPHRHPGASLLHLSMRLVSVLMATGALVVAAILAHRLGGAHRGRLAMLVLLVSPTWLYYAKVANVDVPYVFWLACSLAAFVSLARQPSVGGAIGLGVSAACAVGTKDQAAGFFVLVPVALVAAEARRRWRDGNRRSVRAALFRVEWVAGLAAAAVTLAAVYQWPVHPALVRDHAGQVLQARYGEMAEATPAGLVQLGRLLVAQLGFAMGWPALALAVAGLWLARRDPARRPLCWLLVPALSYLVFFIGVTRYSYDRFLLGIVLVLAPFAAHAACRLLEVEGRWRLVARLGLLLALAYSVGYGWTVNQMMARDARLGAEAALRRSVRPGDTVAFLGLRTYLPRLGRFDPVEVAPSLPALRGRSPHWLVLNERFAQRWAHEPEAADLLAGLRRGDLGCERAFAGPSPLSWWAFAQYSSWVRRPDESGYIILDKVNPPVAVYDCRGLHRAGTSPR